MKNLITLILTVTFAATVSAQKQPKNECSLEFARNLVEQQANESKNIEATNKRLKILTSVAEFLWKTDEPTARKYLAEAFGFADSRFKEKGFEKKKIGANITVSDKDYRFEVINFIGKYDIAWAKKLTAKVLKDFEEDDKSKRDDFDKNKEVDDVLDFAMKIYDQNPQFALAQLRNAMKYPLSQSWEFILVELSVKNQQEADKLYSELLTRYADSPIKDLYDLSDYPFGTGTISSIGSTTTNDIPKSFVPNPILQRQFLTLILQRAVSFEPDNNQTPPKNSWEQPDVAYLFHALRGFEKIVQRDFSDLAENWAVAKIQILAYLSEGSLKEIEETDKWQNEEKTSFERQLEELQKDDELGKLTDNNILRLVRKARKEEEFATAESWLDKIKDAKLRESVSLFYYFMRTDLAIKDKRLYEARKLASKIAKIDFRALELLKIAEEKLKEKLGKAESQDILLEVYQTAVKADNSTAKAQVLFSLAFVYEKVNHQNAINSLSESIQTINALENTDDLLSSELTILIQSNSFAMTSTVSSPGLNLENVIKEIGKNDFSNTLNYVSSFTDKYLRALAVIEVAKNCKEITKPKVIKK
jgi:hypothetical protein